MSNKSFKKLISWIPVFIWMGVIFYLSHQPASISSELSSGITEKILHIIVAIVSFIPIDLDYFHHLIRKGAHFFAYFILGILVTNALGARNIKFAALALLICVLYAISDEVHQLFIPGRSGEARDVLIDGAGTLVGIGVYFFIKKALHLMKRR